MFAWSQLEFSVIPVPISAVSLTRRQTWQNVNSKRRLQRIQNVQLGKGHQKKETSSCFCLCCFCFWGEVSNSWILNDLGRNFLLGNRKKIAKFLMGTFTCRSTFLYASQLTVLTVHFCFAMYFCNLILSCFPHPERSAVKLFSISNSAHNKLLL
jgi:hypothetical protein